MLTPFGIVVRKFRLDKGMRLLDLADRVGRSPAFLSAVETGRKPIPNGLITSIADAMALTDAEKEVLQRAADRTRKEVRLDKLPQDQRELVAAFARKVDGMTAEELRAFKKKVFNSLSSEVPFQRKRRGILVPPASAKSIRQFAETVRSALVEDDVVSFPIMDVLEFKMERFFEGFYLDVRGRDELGAEEGRMIAGVNGIILREDVYEGAWLGNRRARFTACHELGHFLMHRTVTMARLCEDQHEIFRDSEWQADTFAGTLLMSPRHLSTFKGASEAADACGMTARAAEVMWAKYQKEGRLP